MAAKQGHEIPTIDVALVTIAGSDGIEIGLRTASKIGVNVQTETVDAVKLVVKGRLLAQKPTQVTITGHTIVLTDNVLIPEVAKKLQGGKIMYWADGEKSREVGEDAGYGVARYTPPVAGSDEKGEVVTLKAYSAVYDTSGIVKEYECIAYPNCQGVPIALSSEDGVFRAPEYTINSAPNKGQAPYEITYVKELPEVTEVVSK